jgi:hypothetical protein
LIGDSRRYDLAVPKFRDDNRNGIQDGGEPPLANIPFTLDLNRNNRYDAATEPLVRTDANGIALFPNLVPGTYSVLEVFDASVNNPFPIPTGPNPVNFDVPGLTTVPTAVPTPVPVATPTLSASAVDLVTGGTGTPTPSPDPLTDGGLVAAKQVSSFDNSIVLDNPGAANVLNGKKWEDGAQAAIAPFLEALKRGDEELFVAPPKVTSSLL